MPPKKKKASSTTRVKVEVTRAPGQSPCFSWCKRGGDTHTVEQVYLSTFAALSQMREPMPPSIQVVPDTIIFSAHGPTTWFAFEPRQRKIIPHAAAQTTAANILMYFTEVMRTRELIDLSRGLPPEGGDQQHQQQMSAIAMKSRLSELPSSAPPCSGTPRFPCAVWMFDGVDVEAQEALAEQDRHVCVEYLDLAGVQNLVDRLITGQSPPHGVLQEYVASETPSLTGTSEEYLCTVQTMQNSSSTLELSALHKFRNLHVPRTETLANVATGAGGLPRAPSPGSPGVGGGTTTISTLSYAAIPPIALLSRTVSGLDADRNTCMVKEPEDRFRELRGSSPGWSVITQAEPLMPSAQAIQETIATAALVLTATARDRDALSTENAVVPYTRCVLWLKPLRDGGFAFLGVMSMRMPQLRLDFTVVDIESIVQFKATANAAAAADSGDEGRNNNEKKSGKAPPSGRRAAGSSSITPVRRRSPPSNRAQQQNHHQQPSSSSPRQTMIPSRPRSALPSRGVRRTDIAQLQQSLHAATTQQNVERIFERGISPPRGGNQQQQQQQQQQQHQNHHAAPSQLPPRPMSGTIRQPPQQQHVPMNQVPTLPPRPMSAATQARPMTPSAFVPVGQQQQSQQQQQQQHQYQQPPTRGVTPVAMGGGHQQQQQQQQQHHPNYNASPAPHVPPPPLPPQNQNAQQQGGSNNKDIQHVFFPVVDERERIGLIAAEMLETKPYTQLEQPDELMCPNCSVWNPRNACYNMSYFAIATAVKAQQGINERKLKHVFPRKGKFTSQRMASSLEEVRECDGGDILFADDFCWAPLPPVLQHVSIDLEEILERDVWRQRTVMVCEACAGEFHHFYQQARPSSAQLALRKHLPGGALYGLHRAGTPIVDPLHPPPTTSRREALLTGIHGRDSIDLTMRAASPEHGGTQTLDNTGHNEGLKTSGVHPVRPFNAAHSQMAAINARYEAPPPASCFSNITDALVTTDLQLQHRDIRQARRDKYAMRLVAADCHRGVDVFSTNLQKQREVEALVDGFVLPPQDAVMASSLLDGDDALFVSHALGGSSQLDDPLSLVLCRELHAAVSKVCREPPELALGVVMPRPSKGKGPWRIPKPVVDHSSGAAAASSSSQLQQQQSSCGHHNDPDDVLDFECPRPLGDEENVRPLSNYHRSNIDAAAGRKAARTSGGMSRQAAEQRNSTRPTSYYALAQGSQTFAEMNETERESVIEFLGGDSTT